MINALHTEAQSLFYQGLRCMEAGNADGAEHSFRTAVQLMPDFAEAYANLALVLDRRGLADSAEHNYRRSIELKPELPEMHLNLGALLTKIKRFDEAEAACARAISLRPHSPEGWSNLGVLYACTHREEKAEQCYRTAIALNAEYATARFNLSYLLLRQGRFEEGWICLEARNAYAALAGHFTCPRWHGEDLTGKSILIGYEGGHGDMIQFCRYAAVLKAQGAASITIICHPALKTLFTTLAAVDSVISFDEPVPPSGWDFWSPLLSVPRYCKTRIDCIPAQIPYLHASPALVRNWAELLPMDGIRVGLAWKGNPQFENDNDRSLASLAMLAPLATVHGVHFVSLQKGPGQEEATCPPAGMALTDLGGQLNDFADTAAVVTNLDLLICVDTAIAHLAGALGTPCWVLLPAFKTDWRWLTDRQDSPWYPHRMRLFRQSTAGGWATVISAVVTSLQRLVRFESFQRHAARQN